MKKRYSSIGAIICLTSVLSLMHVSSYALEVVNSIRTQGMKNIRLTPDQVLCSPSGMFALEFTADNTMQLKSAYGDKYSWIPKMDGAKQANGLNGPSGCLLLQRDGNIGMYSSCDPTGGNANGTWVWSLDRQTGIGKVDYSRFKEKEYWELLLDNNGKLSIMDRSDAPTPEFVISPEVDLSQITDSTAVPLAECGVNGLPPTQVTAEDMIDTNLVDSSQSVSAETYIPEEVQADVVEYIEVDPTLSFE